MSQPHKTIFGHFFTYTELLVLGGISHVDSSGGDGDVVSALLSMLVLAVVTDVRVQW